MDSAAIVAERPISKEQIKIIHTLKSKMGMSDRAYRQRLGRVGVKSCKEMTYERAKGFIHYLKIDAAKKLGKTYARNGYGAKHITPAQMAMVRAMWAEISYLTDPNEREAALSHLVENKFHVSVISWMPRWQVPKLVSLLRAMKADMLGKQTRERAEQAMAATSAPAETPQATVNG